jgi:hypothetical protein
VEGEVAVPRSWICQLACVSALLFLMTAFVGAEADQAADTKKAGAKKDDNNTGNDLASRIKARLYEQAKKEDLNNDGYLSLDELITWLGITAAQEMIKKYDKDGDKKLLYRPDSSGGTGASQENEFEAWAADYADRYAKWYTQQEQAYANRIQALENQLAAAANNARNRAQIDAELRRERQMLEQFRREARNADNAARREFERHQQQQQKKK